MQVGAKHFHTLAPANSEAFALIEKVMEDNPGIEQSPGFMAFANELINDRSIEDEDRMTAIFWKAYQDKGYSPAKVMRKFRNLSNRFHRLVNDENF